MAHVQDLWEKTVDGWRVRTDRYGKGGRWQARYHDPDGRERTRMFDRRQDADRFLITVSADVLRGAYVDPDAGKVTFAEFAERWLAAQTFGESWREATELRLRLHAGRHFGTRELRNIKPSVIPVMAPQAPTGACPDLRAHRVHQRVGRVQRRRRRRADRIEPVPGRLGEAPQA